MLLLAFHVVAVGVLVAVVGTIAYRMGIAEGQRRARALSERQE